MFSQIQYIIRKKLKAPYFYRKIWHYAFLCLICIFHWCSYLSFSSKKGILSIVLLEISDFWKSFVDIFPLFGMIYSHSTLSQLSLLDISLKFYEEKLQNKWALEHRQCISLQWIQISHLNSTSKITKISWVLSGIVFLSESDSEVFVELFQIS